MELDLARFSLRSVVPALREKKLRSKVCTNARNLTFLLIFHRVCLVSVLPAGPSLPLPLTLSLPFYPPLSLSPSHSPDSSFLSHSLHPFPPFSLFLPLSLPSPPSVSLSSLTSAASPSPLRPRPPWRSCLLLPSLVTLAAQRPALPLLLRSFSSLSRYHCPG